MFYLAEIAREAREIREACERSHGRVDQTRAAWKGPLYDRPWVAPAGVAGSPLPAFLERSP
jgi:hypothetical protein